MLHLACWLLTTLTAGPAVYWHSAPVSPGQLVVVNGGGWGDTPQVTVAPLPDGLTGRAGAAKPVKLVTGSDAGFQFELPKGAQLAEVKVSGSGGSTTFVVNQPEIYWLQGDLGLSASPGGWLRIQGRCLAWDGQQTVVELGEGRSAQRLKVGRATPYSLSVSLPADLKPGSYAVKIHAGGGDAGWSAPGKIQVEPAPAVSDRVVNAKDEGATGDGAYDDTVVIQKSLNALAEAGGGTLLLPAGRYKVSDTLVIPPGVTLQGEAEDRVALLWPDTETPPYRMIRGTHHWGLTDLTIYCSNHQHVIAGDTDPTQEIGHVRVQRVRVRANPYRGHLKPEQLDERLRAGLKLSTGCGDTLQLGGPDIIVTDCDFYGGGRSFFLHGVEGALLARNKFSNGRWGWYSISGANGLILEDNVIHGGDLMSTGGGINCLYGYTVSQNVYYARNTLSDMHGWDREAMTSDAGGGCYFGHVAGTEGNVVKLAEPITGGRRDWAGAALFINDGHGRGQYRQVLKAEGGLVTIESPFAVAPDETSIVTLTMLQRHYLLLENSFTDAGIGIQLYGCAVEHIMDGNEVTRAGGFHGQARSYHGIQPEFGIQFLRCRIKEGNCYRFGANNAVSSGPSHIGLHAFSGAHLIGGVIRDCRLDADAQIEIKAANGDTPTVENVVIEDNQVSNNPIGVSVDRNVAAVTVRGNVFHDVKVEIRHIAELLKEWEQQKAAMTQGNGPLVRYSFDQPFADGADDDTGHKLRATVTGSATFEDGLVGKALRPGKDGFLQVGSPETFAADLFCLPAVTVSAWIKPDTTSGRYGVVSKRSANSSAPFILGTNGAQLGFEATDEQGQWSYNFMVPNQIVANEWQQIAVIVVSGQGATLYRNGVAVGHKDATTFIARTTLPLRIGWDAWGGPQSTTAEQAYFPGLIDEVVIYPRALTPAEMKAEYDKLAEKAKG